MATDSWSRVRKAIQVARTSAIRIFSAVALVAVIASGVLAYLNASRIEDFYRTHRRDVERKVDQQLRRIAAFQVQEILIRGNEYTPSQHVARALALRDSAYLWDHYGPARNRIQSIPGVEEVRIDRKIPSTLVISIRESEPVAWVESGGIRSLVTEAGEALTREASERVTLKLPTVIADKGALKNGKIANAEIRQMLHSIHRLTQSGIAWAPLIKEIVPRKDGSFEVKLSALGAPPLLISPNLTPQHANLLQSTLGDFQKRHGDTREIVYADLRFREQILIRSRGKNEPRESPPMVTAQAPDSVAGTPTDQPH